MIPGHFDPSSIHPDAPWAWAFAQRQDPNFPPSLTSPIQFLVDTGASHSVVSAADAISTLGFSEDFLSDHTHWPESDLARPGGFGGRIYALRVPVLLFFAAEDESRFVHPCTVMVVELTTPTSEAITPRAPPNEVPSILGWDVLQYFDIHINKRQRLVRLDPIEGPHWITLPRPKSNPG